MPRARTILRLGFPIAAAAHAACARRPASVAVLEPPSVTCATRDTVLAVLTVEVREETARASLIERPGGECADVVLRRVTPAEAKDVLDAGTPILITSLAPLLEYSARQAELTSLPLAWERGYALVRRHGAPIPIDESGLAALREDLVRDVVRGDARVATAPSCGDASLHSSGSATDVRYDATDPIARSIASRLVAITPGGDSLRTVATRDGEGPDGAATAVIAYSIGRPLPCERGRVIPLVEIRARAIGRAVPR